MEFVKLYTTTHDDPKMLDLSDRAFRCYVNALSWCGRHEEDGKLPASLIPAKQLAELTAAGLIDPGPVIHNWCDRQWTRSQMNAKRIAGRKGAAVRWASEPHSQPHATPNAEVEEEEEVEEPTSKPPPTAVSEDYFDAGKWEHLLGKLHDQGYTAKGQGSLTWKLLMRLRLKYGSRVVDSALSDATLGEGVPLGSAAAYFESICARFQEAQSA